MSQRSKRFQREAWHFACLRCGRRGTYAGTYEGVKRRRHTARGCGGELRITGRAG